MLPTSQVFQGAAPDTSAWSRANCAARTSPDISQAELPAVVMPMSSRPPGEPMAFRMPLLASGSPQPGVVAIWFCQPASKLSWMPSWVS